ncbi:MAG: beta-N-acetylhexosaminidase [Cyclobacteriaceae bacterium]
MIKNNKFLSFLVIALLVITPNIPTLASDLTNLGLHVIPYPQQVELGGSDFELSGTVNVVLDKNAGEVDKATADKLKSELETHWGVKAVVGTTSGSTNIFLTRKGATKDLKAEGYQLSTDQKNLTITANDEDGLFYGVQTLFQVLKKTRSGVIVPGMEITDWPDIAVRAVHYDTKHHQDKASYVKSFIRDMAKYKINMLVWEWEDKLAYTSHPEIGAPGAFTIEEMQEFTRYAKEYHIELTPLVQGLGHVSFILKWPQYRHLREVDDSDWEFCPLEDGTYDLLFDLWDEAMEATPGSEYIHIGSDETFELGLCEKCRAKANEIGNSGLYHLFAGKAAKHLKKSRKVMLWERPMGWKMSRSPIKNMEPDNDLILTEEYHYNKAAFEYVKEAKDLGFEVFVYDPNPGLEPLFLPYHFKLRGRTRIDDGSMKNSYNTVAPAAQSGLFDGMINTSWDDSGLHNQMWMLSFVTSAQYSWNGAAPGLDEFEQSFFFNYYGKDVVDMKELYQLLNEASYYYAWSLERNVWHHGTIGKTHLPDLPRRQYIEYDPFWNQEYEEMVKKSRTMQSKMLRTMQIIDMNKDLSTSNAYDFDVYRTIAELVDHTCQTFLDISELERTITRAHKEAFSDRKAAIGHLMEAESLIEESLERREKVYNNLVSVWEQTRMPKGISTPEKAYFYKMDRSRHYANRTPDMSYLIYDEQLLDMEGYLEALRAYRKTLKTDF